jgi:hypothetical protein
MELTFELMDDGYTILRDGVPWIVQDNQRFPYPGDTIEQSANNHISELKAAQEVEPSLSLEEQLAALRKENEDLKASQLEQDSLIMQLMLGGIM